jgi:hypothetical protein
VKKYKVMDAHSLIFQLNGKKKDDALTNIEKRYKAR